MIKFHKSMAYKEMIDICVTKKEKTSMLELLFSLSENTNLTLEIENIKKLKGKSFAKLKAFELKKGVIRIFFTTIGQDIYIVHVARKQKNKTEKNDLDLVKKRLKEVYKCN